MPDLGGAAALMSARAVRARADAVFALADAGRLPGWRLHMDRLPVAADLVAETVRANYPSLAVPFHARWRHFVVGGQDLWAPCAARFTDPAARARAAFDLAVVSVLLDAGAGMAWRYRDAATGAVLARSEGLGVASLRMFEAGLFSADPADPLRADAARLATLTSGDLAAGFQVGPDNPLVGLEGRAGLLAALGRALLADRRLASARPGALFDRLAAGGPVPAATILEAVLVHLGPVWPGRLTVDGVDLGDTWPLPALGTGIDGLVPFHKLSQWLSYSLIEPLQAAGVAVVEIDGLTGLPEYRNGGLFLDTGVIALADPADAARTHDVGSPLIVGWRALTVALLDRIAPLVRERTGRPDWPLATILEGGTWAAGRRIAARLRADGGPPLKVASDGTVF